jgi:MFS transporter, DHA1 family, multidrug resistance protein
MFFGSFSWSFVYISLPFHIQAISTWDASATLRWTGWILGITPLVTVVTAPLWGRLGGSGDPKTLYAGVQAVQGIGFFGMAIARTLPELFLARLILGVMGAASTFAFMSAGRSTDIREVRRQVAAVQSAMTVGQVIGPLAGAIAAARLGFQESFVLGGLVLVACGALVHWGVPRSGVPETPATIGGRTRWREVIAVAFMLLGGSTQIFFLTSILPQVLPPLGVEPSRTLEVGGFIIFASGAAAALGSVLAPRLSEVWPEHRLIAALLVASSVSVALLALVSSVWLYGILRFLQVLFIAPIFPIVVSRITQSAGGEAIGVINSARIGAAFIGPVIATTMLAWTSPALLYVVLAAIGVSCLPLASVRAPSAERRAG